MTPEGFNLFSGLRDGAPDGWGRHLLNRAADALELTEFDYLVRSGVDRVGALASGREQTVENALAAAAFFQLTSDQAQEIFEKIFRVVKDWRQHYHKAGVSPRELNALTKAFSETERYKLDSRNHRP